MEKLKPSRYNLIVPSGESNYLLFNSFCCGLAELDREHHSTFESLCGCDPNGAPKPLPNDSFLDQLKLGGFLIPEDMDELDVVKYRHYMSRFNDHAFGMTIIPTLRCNFSCDYCYQNEKTHLPGDAASGDMSEDVQEALVKIVDTRVKENSHFTVTWYGGEPLLCKAIIASLSKRFKELCSSRKSHYHAGMITNGYLLTAQAVSLLQEVDVRFCQITLDGPREVHDKRRPLRSGRGTFDRIIENIVGLLDCSDIAVSLRINVDNRNKDSVPELLNYLKVIGFHTRPNIAIYFGHVLHYASSCNDVAQHCMITEEFARYQIEAYQLALDLGFRIAPYPAANIGTCGAVAINSMVIEPGGNTQNCWNAVGIDTYRSGKLTGNGLELTSNFHKWLAWSPFRSDCEKCSVLPICMGGCPYKFLYAQELSEADRNTCVAWKYNLVPMLKLYHEASRRGLLGGVGRGSGVPSEDSKSLEREEKVS